MRALFATLVAPPTCSGCHRPGIEWCAGCAATLPQPRWLDVGIPVRAEFEFAGPIRRSIIDWKDECRREARMRVEAWFAQGLRPLIDGVPNAVLVPVPASPRSIRQRGAGVLEAAIRAAVPDAAVHPWLQSARNRGDQAGLDRAQRAANLVGSMRWVGPANRPIILVDDIVTSGATLRESVRAMTVAGVHPEIGFVIAYRERRDPVARHRAGLRLS